MILINLLFHMEFRYFGHGGGEQYAKGHRIRKLDKCAVSLLMGCSSGRLKPESEFDPTGTPLNYLMGGW
jgi:separase